MLSANQAKNKATTNTEKEEVKSTLSELYTKPCPKNCKDAKCRNFHDPSQRRRVPILENNKWSYKPKLCKNSLSCYRKDFCNFAHTQNEISYHPCIYKTLPCSNKKQGQTNPCQNSRELCSFYHSQEDKRCIFKIYPCDNARTCPGDCIYYHCTSDKRRDPSIFSYSPVPCKFAKQEDFCSFVECPNGDSCNLSHTKNEVYYHPDVYMKFQCKAVKCFNSNCAFIHPNSPSIEEESTDFSTKANEAIEKSNSFACSCEGKAIAICKCGKMLCKSCIQRGCGSCNKLEVLVLDKGEDAKAKKKNFACGKCKINLSKCIYRCGFPVCYSCLGQSCDNCSKNHITLLGKLSNYL